MCPASNNNLQRMHGWQHIHCNKLHKLLQSTAIRSTIRREAALMAVSTSKQYKVPTIESNVQEQQQDKAGHINERLVMMYLLFTQWEGMLLNNLETLADAVYNISINSLYASARMLLVSRKQYSSCSR